MKDFLKEKAKEFGINLSEEQLEQFKIYYEYLCEYNSHTNIVASDDIEIVYKKHFLDSLAFGKIPLVPQKFKLIDIGSGGGFPAIPIAIAFPEAKITCVDSVGKKAIFLTHLAHKLGIEKRVKIFNERIEELDDKFKGKFDFVTARAVAQLNTLSEYCLPYVKIDGAFVAYKAKTTQEEIKEAKKAFQVLGGSVAEVIDYNIDDETTHNLIIIEKVQKSPTKYPRKAGAPKKNPL